MRKAIPTLTQQVIMFADSPELEIRLTAAKAFWSLSSKLVTETVAVQHEACMAVLPVIARLVEEKDEIKVPVLKGIRDLCQILTLHEFLIRQGVLDLLITTVQSPQTKKPLEACLFCLSALAGNNNEVAATHVVNRVLPRLVQILSNDSANPTVVANVLALINVLALYRNLVPVLHADSGLMSRISTFQEEGSSHVKTNAGIAKARLSDFRESPIGPNRVRSDDNTASSALAGAVSAPPAPAAFDGVASSSSVSSVVCYPFDSGAAGSGHPTAAATVGQRARETRQRSIKVKQHDIQQLQLSGLSLEQAKRALIETNSFDDAVEFAREHYPDDFAKTPILDDLYGEPPLPPTFSQQRSMEQPPMQKSSSAGFAHDSPLSLSGEDLGLQRKASLPRIGEDASLRRKDSRDRPARSKSNESPLQEVLQRRDSRRREGDDKPTRAGSGDQRRREPRKVSGEEHSPTYYEGERIANLDKAFESNGKWPDGIATMHFREPKASTLPNKKHGNFDVKKRQDNNGRVDTWLRCYGFGEYSNQFAAQKITYDTLLRLTMEDLEQLGVHALGDRKAMMYQISKDLKKMRSKEKREFKENVLHIAVLQSNPLNGPETPGFPNKLDLRTERSILCDSFRESGRQIRVRFAPATSDNLLKMITKGCQALHISGHGDPRNLMLEDGKGGSMELDVGTLRNMLELGGNELQFVFISACFSATAANAFVEAGVPHVIAVQESVQITDTSARSYARHVYMALCLGLPVEKAFAKGQAAVLANGCPKPCCCAHLHSPGCALCPRCRTPVCCTKHGEAGCHAVTRCCAPQIPHDESLKFLLLPSTSDHSVKLFEGVSLGDWVNCTPHKIINNLPSIPDHFAGRSKDMLYVVQTILKPSRLTTIVGPAGVGKSALARAAASYVHERRHFEGGCFLVRLTGCTQVEQIRQALAQAMESVVPVKPNSGATETLHRSALYVFDDCDEFINDSDNQKVFKDFVQAFLERHAQATVLMTSQQSVGRIDGLTHRILTLGPLHQLDGAALFLNRIPRDLKNNDFGDSGFGLGLTSLHQLASYPLFPRLKGNPRLIEWCAEMLNHMPLCDLDRCLSIPTGQWPTMSEAARLLLLRIKAFVMISYRPQPEQDQPKQAASSSSDPQLQQILQLQNLLGLNSTPISPRAISLPNPFFTPSKVPSLPLSPPPQLHVSSVPVSSPSALLVPNAALTASFEMFSSNSASILPLPDIRSLSSDNNSLGLSRASAQTPVFVEATSSNSALVVSLSSPHSATFNPHVISSPRALSSQDISTNFLSTNPLSPPSPKHDSPSSPSRQISGSKQASLVCPEPSTRVRNSPPPPSRPPPPTSAASRHKHRDVKSEKTN